IDRGGQSPLELTVPSGQHTALVMDLEQPLLYVDGEVNLRYMGDLAFVRQLVDPASALAWWPVDLVLPQTLTFSVNGVIGQGVTPNLALTAGYQVEPGVFGQWLRLDGALVEAEGSLVLGPQGLLLAGQAHSALMPEAMTEDALAAQVFIPFDGVQAVYARLQSTLEAPLAAGPASAATALAEAAPALATATVISPTAVAPAEEMRAEGV